MLERLITFLKSGKTGKGRGDTKEVGENDLVR